MAVGLHIGEFSRRVGVSADLLRAWERRYGLLQPVRTGGGFRLYTDDDAARVARMRDGLSAGLPASQAARAALASGTTPGGLVHDAPGRLVAAIGAYDETAANAVLDETFAAFTLDAALGEVVLPALARVGELWADGELDAGHEHFGSLVIRGRLLALARLAGRGTGGPLAVLACVPGEEHDLSLLSFGLLLRSYGWRTLFLGADTPLDTVAAAAARTSPAAVVVVAFKPARATAVRAELTRLAKSCRLVLAGPGCSAALAEEVGAELLEADVVAGAALLAA